MPFSPPVGRLHVLTDFHFQQRLPHAEIARQAAAGGADTVQFRQKTGTLRDQWANLVPTVDACRAAGVPCLVDDHVDLALAAGADGVHLGALDLPIHAARRVLDTIGPGHLLGATATTPEAARQAEADGADYIGFGPVFATGSKDSPASVKGLDGLARACEAVSIPVIAIAGITPKRVAPCLDAGAWGVAVMTAVTTAPDVAAAAAAFCEAIERWR